MIKILNKIDGFENKVNFVDSNNVCVGYDLSQDCCEEADWFISKNEEVKAYDDEKLGIGKYDLSSYVFDKDYFESASLSGGDMGGIARFKMTDGNSVLYLHLYNSHNGYYCHGFTFMDGDNEIEADYL